MTDIEKTTVETTEPEPTKESVTVERTPETTTTTTEETPASTDVTVERDPK